MNSKDIIRSLLRRFNLELRKKTSLDALLSNTVQIDVWKNDLAFTLEFGPKIGVDFLRLMELSKSQSRQDIFALYELGFKRNGFFVEFGATDGVTLSNTYLLEKEFGYKGILAEPNPRQRKKILTDRSASFEKDCVWSKTGVRMEFVDFHDLSGLHEVAHYDRHSSAKSNKQTFWVNTISLTDMLDKHKAPTLIDYLSIDVEGAEYEILSNHNFLKYNFSVISVEHNFTSQRDLIYDLLRSKGYKRKYEKFSLQDDWYVFG
jgi:FkbM family methyltransferase